MWRLALVSFVLWNTITSQPVTEDQENDAPRHPRQLDFVHCCPCPSPDLPNPGFNAPNVGADSLVRAAPVDDCPCRDRSSDGQGASSAFFPRTVPFRPFMNQPEAEKEDQKPLLHPEVDLASSMLQTLREVTDEEYQDALARDAARNAARVNDLGDAEPETAKNLVTIIVNPRSDMEDDGEGSHPEASNVQETRCAHPIGTPHLGQVRESSNKFKLQPNLLLRDALDMADGASDVKENIVSLTKGLEGLKFKTKLPALKLFPNRKPHESNIQSLLKLKNDKLPKGDQQSNGLKNNLGTKIPNLRLTELFKKAEPLPLKPSPIDIKKLKIPTLRVNLGKKTIAGTAINNDSGASPSAIQEIFFKPGQTINTANPDAKISDNNRAQFSLKNLLNLDNVLTPPKSNLPKIKIPGFSLIPPLNVNNPSADISEIPKACKVKEQETIKEAGVERSQQFHTEILDTLPHASDNHPVFVPTNTLVETTTVIIDNEPTMNEDTNIKTKILDALPSASENMNTMTNNKHMITTSTASSSEINDTTNTELDSEVHKSEESELESGLFTKENLVNSYPDDSSLEFIIEGDEDTEIEAIEFIEDTDEPINAINIGGVSFENDGQSFNINFIEDTDSLEESDTVMVQNDASNDAVADLNEEQEENGSQVKDTVNSVDTLFRGDTPLNEMNVEFNQEPTDENVFLKEYTEETNDNASDSTLKSAESLEESAGNSQPSPKSNPLPSLKEKIELKLETLKNPENTKILTISRLSQPHPRHEAQAVFAKVDNSTEATMDFSIEQNSFTNESDEPRQVTLHDLSRISDSLLAASQSKLMHLRETHVFEGNSDSNESDIENKSAESNNREVDLDADTESSATTVNEQIVEENVVDIKDKSNENHYKDRSKMNTEERYNVGTTIINSCPSNFESSQELSEKPEKTESNDRNDENEMYPQDSENIKNAAQPLGLAPFLQQGIVQPNPLFDPNTLLPTLPPLNLESLNLPTVGDLTSGLQDLFGGKARVNDGDEISSEFVSSEDCSEEGDRMETGASTNKVKSAFAPLNPLEDINLDIFQINPLSGGLGSKLPSLNLNSFKAKLPLPPSLELKPLKLESTLGRNNGALLGASLTFGPEKSKSAINNLGSILNKEDFDILRTPLSSFPNLEELRSLMSANTQSLLKSPLIKQTHNPLEETLKSSLALGDSLRSHTESTMKNLQKSLAPTLSKHRSSGKKSPSNNIAKPQELLDMVTLAHEDMNDKLEALHIDLQDRLSSIHDRIIDQSKLPALKSPLLGLTKVVEEPSGSWKLGNQRNKPSTSSQSARRTPKPKMVISKKSKAKVNKPKGHEGNELKPFKFSKAASSLTPKTVEVPKLMTTSSAPPFFRTLQRDNNLMLRESASNILDKSQKTPLIKKLKPFRDIKITFETTPLPPTTKTTLKPKASKSSSVVKMEQKSRLQNPPKKLRQEILSDAGGFASEPKPSQVCATGITLQLPCSDLPDVPCPKIVSNSRTLHSKPLALTEKMPSKTTVPKLTLPKPTESPLVAKMREAIKIRLSHPVKPPKLQHMAPLAKKMRSDDVSDAASENNAVILKPEPMKENVSYKCKMVCVRD